MYFKLKGRTPRKNFTLDANYTLQGGSYLGEIGIERPIKALEFTANSLYVYIVTTLTPHIPHIF